MLWVLWFPFIGFLSFWLWDSILIWNLTEWVEAGIHLPPHSFGSNCSFPLTVRKHFFSSATFQSVNFDPFPRDFLQMSAAKIGRNKVMDIWTVMNPVQNLLKIPDDTLIAVPLKLLCHNYCSFAFENQVKTKCNKRRSKHFKYFFFVELFWQKLNWKRAFS